MGTIHARTRVTLTCGPRVDMHVTMHMAPHANPYGGRRLRVRQENPRQQTGRGNERLLQQTYRG